MANIKKGSNSIVDSLQEKAMHLNQRTDGSFIRNWTRAADATDSIPEIQRDLEIDRIRQWHLRVMDHT